MAAGTWVSVLSSVSGTRPVRVLASFSTNAVTEHQVDRKYCTRMGRVGPPCWSAKLCNSRIGEIIPRESSRCITSRQGMQQRRANQGRDRADEGPPEPGVAHPRGEVREDEERGELDGRRGAGGDDCGLHGGETEAFDDLAGELRGAKTCQSRRSRCNVLARLHTMQDFAQCKLRLRARHAARGYAGLPGKQMSMAWYFR